MAKTMQQIEQQYNISNSTIRTLIHGRLNFMYSPQSKRSKFTGDRKPAIFTQNNEFTLTVQDGYMITEQGEQYIKEKYGIREKVVSAI